MLSCFIFFEIFVPCTFGKDAGFDIDDLYEERKLHSDLVVSTCIKKRV